MLLFIYLVVDIICTRHIQAVDLLHSETLRLFSNGVLQYLVSPQEDVLCSLLDGLGCGGRTAKPIKMQINLSRNLKLHRMDETTLQMIDIVTNNPLPGFPGHFSSNRELMEWQQQLLSIVQYTASYKRYLGIALKERICLTYSGSRIFCGVVVFIGDIRYYGTSHAQRPYFAVRVSPHEMAKANVKHHVDASMITDGLFGGIRYFNYIGNTPDTYIVMDSAQIFHHHQCLGTAADGRVQILAEAKDFFTLTMPQIWKIGSELNGRDIAIPGSEHMDQIHIDAMDLSKLEVRLFNYESQRSLSNPTFKAKVKVFGAVNIALHVRTSSGRKYSKSDVKIAQLFIGGVIKVNYQFAMRDSKQQLLQIGFLRTPWIEISKTSNVDQFPNELIGTNYANAIEWLQSIIQTLLERRGIENMISWSIGSPYD